MKRILLIVAIVLVALSISCSSVNFQGIQAVKDMPEFRIIGEFDKKISDGGLIGWIGGSKIVPFGQPDEEIFSKIQDEIQKMSGDGAINVELSYGVTFMDVVLTSITGGVYAANTITIKGTIVKFVD